MNVTQQMKSIKSQSKIKTVDHYNVLIKEVTGNIIQNIKSKK